MRYVITLVHGNRPKANGRLAAGSFLRRELDGKLADVRFREFAWPGANTHAARIEAGDRLAAFMRDGHEQDPDARHFIVGHSHGGNVALYAMRHPAVREIVSGVVTLGTPFMHTRRRDPRRYADIIAWLLLSVAALVPLTVFDALSLRPAALASLLVSPFLIVAMQPRVARWLTEIAAHEQDEIVAAVQQPIIERATLAIFCARGDEAGQWLRIWKVLTEAPLVAGCVILGIVAAIARFNLPIAVDHLTTSAGLGGLNDMHAFGLDGWALMSGAVVLSLLWVAVLMVSSVVRRPGYWREPLLANTLVEIGTSTVPTAGVEHMVHFFDVAGETARNRFASRALRHSAICDDASVVSAIGNWIADGVRPR